MGAGLAVFALAACSAPAVSPASASPSASGSASPSPRTSRGPVNAVVPEIGYPRAGGGQYEYAAAAGPVSGAAGPLLAYRVAVERDITGASAAAFAEAVGAVFADPRSWPGTGKWRLRR